MIGVKLLPCKSGKVPYVHLAAWFGDNSFMTFCGKSFSNERIEGLIEEGEKHKANWTGKDSVCWNCWNSANTQFPEGLRE